MVGALFLFIYITFRFELQNSSTEIMYSELLL